MIEMSGNRSPTLCHVNKGFNLDGQTKKQRSAYNIKCSVPLGNVTRYQVMQLAVHMEYLNLHLPGARHPLKLKMASHITSFLRILLLFHLFESQRYWTLHSKNHCHDIRLQFMATQS